MKTLPILIIAMWSITACQSTPKGKNKTEQTQINPQKTKARDTLKPAYPPTSPKVKDKIIGRTSTGKTYIVERKEEAGKVSYTLNGEGFQFAKATKLLSHANVKEVLTADLDKDGFDEAYIIYDCQEKGESQPIIVGFVSYKDRAFGPIYVRSASAKQLVGYRGQDTVYVENGQLIRTFPIYEGASDTGRKQTINYVLEAGESGFVLRPSK